MKKCTYCSVMVSGADCECHCTLVRTALENPFGLIDPLHLLDYCRIPRTRKVIDCFLGCEDRPNVRIMYIKPLIDLGYLAQTLPHKARSKYQRYYSIM